MILNSIHGGLKPIRILVILLEKSDVLYCESELVWRVHVNRKLSEWSSEDATSAVVGTVGEDNDREVNWKIDDDEGT